MQIFEDIYLKEAWGSIALDYCFSLVAAIQPITEVLIEITFFYRSENLSHLSVIVRVTIIMACTYTWGLEELHEKWLKCLSCLNELVKFGPWRGSLGLGGAPWCLEELHKKGLNRLNEVVK